MALSSITPTNCWTKVERKVADTLLTCASLLPFLGVANATEAEAGNMWFDAVDPPSNGEDYSDTEWAALFPNVIIGTPGDDASGLELQNVASGPTYVKAGTVELVFAARLTDPFSGSWMRTWLDVKLPGTLPGTEEPTLSDQERIFKNAIGDILEEMQTKEILETAEIAVQEYGRNADNDHHEMGIIQSCRVYLSWGNRAPGMHDVRIQDTSERINAGHQGTTAAEADQIGVGDRGSPLARQVLPVQVHTSRSSQIQLRSAKNEERPHRNDQEASKSRYAGAERESVDMDRNKQGACSNASNSSEQQAVKRHVTYTGLQLHATREQGTVNARTNNARRIHASVT